ncbi:MAG TPA: Rieske 2Fe-2S domain-containing protein [Baekduia sp.]|nr:Rieske 2Fe-2S domain-containing protein [Baekduia sp.]
MPAAPASHVADHLSPAAIRRALERAWWPVCRVEDCVTPHRATLLERALVVFHTADGQPRVADDRCPHRGASLAGGSVDGDAIACPYHGWRWDAASGRCRHIPSLIDQRRIPSAARLATYPAAERWGLVWTCLAPADAAAPLPDPDWLRELDWVHGIVRRDLDANVLLVHENFRDVAHFGFVHPDTVPVATTTVEPLEPRRDGPIVRLERRVDTLDQGPTWLSAEAFVQRYEAIAPSFVSYRADFGAAGTTYLLNCPSPVSLERTRGFFVRGIDAGRADLLPELLAAEERIADEDAAIVSTCEPRRLGEPLDHQVHTLSDGFTLAFRRAFFDYVRAAA